MKGYARIFRRLWADEKFRNLPPHPGQWVVLYVLSCASNRIGIFTVSVGDIGERLDLRPSDVGVLLADVCRAMEWPWDAPTRTVWVPSWWRWNPPESPSALVGYLKDLRDIPESSVRESYLRTIPNLPDTLRTAWRQGVGHPARRLPHTLTAGSRAHAHVGPEPEHEHKPDPEPDQPASLDSAPASLPEHGGRAVAGATNPWHPPRQLLDQLQAADQDLDLEALVVDVTIGLAEGRVRHGNGTLRAWAKAAKEKGTFRRPKPVQANGAAVAKTLADAFRRTFLRRLDGVRLPPDAADRLWQRAQDAVRSGASEQLVLFGPKYLAAWVNEEATRGQLASSTGGKEEP